MVLFICQQKIISQKVDSVAIHKHSILTDRYEIGIGFFVNLKSVKLNVDGVLPSNPFDFGQTLGLSRQENTLDLNLTWRFSKQKKWYFGLEFFTVRNSQSAVLEDDIKWANTIYPVGVALDTGFNIDLYRIFFGRVISMGKNHELSGGIGLHAMKINTFAQARAFLGDTDLVLDTNRKKIDVIAPVPNIGFRYIYAPNLRWSFKANLDWFTLKIGDYKGTLWNVSPQVSFQVIDNIRVGLGYKYFKSKLDVNKDIWKGALDLLYQGPLFSISGNF